MKKLTASIILLILPIAAHALPIGSERYIATYSAPNGSNASVGFDGFDSGGAIELMGSALFGFHVYSTTGGPYPDPLPGSPWPTGYVSYYTDSGHGGIEYNAANEITDFSFTGYSIGSGTEVYQFGFDLFSAHGIWWHPLTLPYNSLNIETTDVKMFGALTITSQSGFVLRGPPDTVQTTAVSVPDAGRTAFLLALGLGSCGIAYRPQGRPSMLDRITRRLLGLM